MPTAQAEALRRPDSPGGTVARSAPLAEAGLATLGALFGLSQFIHGAYNEATWSPIALGALALVLALTVGTRRRPPLAALLPLIGLWLWSLLSSGWSDSTDAANTGANLWLLYAATLACVWWAVAGEHRRAVALLNGASAGVLCVAAWMLVKMLIGHGPDLFYRTRLTYPVGYADGQAGFLLLAIWPCLALAERHGSRRAAAIAGAGLAGIVVLVALALLSQSRSWAVGLMAAIALVLAALPGRRRRISALTLTAVIVAVLYVPLHDVWSAPDPVTGLATVATTRRAAIAIIVAALLAGVVWAIVVAGFERMAPVGSSARARVVTLSRATLAAVGVLAVLAVAVNAGAIAHRIHSQYEAFVNLAPRPNGLRLFSGGGDRYDYWRVAILEFRSDPIKGVGAGNYEWDYYLRRRTSETVTQPHSLELQTLAELGLVGFLLLLVFLAAVAIGFRRTARAARASPGACAVAIAGGGAFAAWLGQTSVDWLHLIPGLTAIALAGAAALLAGGAQRVAVLPGRGRIVVIAAAAALAVAGAVTIAPRVLSLHAQSSAEHELAAGKAQAAIADATSAISYDPNSVDALVMRSAGFARLDEFAPTLADLRRAIAVEPKNWATWGVLGDLLARRGDLAGAKAAYVHGLSLDPRELVLRIALDSVEREQK